MFFISLQLCYFSYVCSFPPPHLVITDYRLPFTLNLFAIPVTDACYSLQLFSISYSSYLSPLLQVTFSAVSVFHHLIILTIQLMCPFNSFGYFSHMTLLAIQVTRPCSLQLIKLSQLYVYVPILFNWPISVMCPLSLDSLDYSSHVSPFT